MFNYNLVSTSMKAENFIKMQYKGDYKKADIKVYQYLIGKLIYLSCRIQSNVLFVIGQWNKPNPDSKIRHLKTAKQVVFYLKGIMYLRIIYNALLLSKKKTKVPMALLPFELIKYTNSNYAGNLEDRKTVIKDCFFIYIVVVFWCSKK